MSEVEQPHRSDLIARMMELGGDMMAQPAATEFHHPGD